MIIHYLHLHQLNGENRLSYSPHMNRVSVNINIVRGVMCGSKLGITLLYMLWTDSIIDGRWRSCTKIHQLQ
jgi:hypothetical protein